MSTEIQKERPGFKLPFPKRGWLIDLILKAAGEEWADPGEELTPYYQRLFSKATTKILLICQDQRLEVVEIPTVKSLISDRNVSLEAIFNKRRADSVEEAVEALKDENPDLISLRNQFPDRVSLFWSPPPPSMNFAVVDSAHALFETPQEKGFNSSITKFNDPFWAEEMKNRFLEFRAIAYEIPREI